MMTKEFLSYTSPDEFDKILELVKPNNEFLGTKINLEKEPFKKVWDVKQIATKGDILELIKCLTGKKEIEILNSDYRAFMYFLKSIKNQLKEIARLEELLNEDNDPDLERAGSDELTDYGYVNYIDRFAQDDFLKWKKAEKRLKKTAWIVVYTKLKLDQTKNRIERNYLKIKHENNRLAQRANL